MLLHQVLSKITPIVSDASLCHVRGISAQARTKIAFTDFGMTAVVASALLP